MRYAAPAFIAISLVHSVAPVAAVSAVDNTAVHLPAGSYVPFYSRDSVKAARDPAAFHRPIRVDAFQLDRYPVSNREFLAFVLAHPEWQKSHVKPIFADAHYLAHWPSDAALQSESEGERPVTNVSWFAAEAYCRAQGKSLPATDQWEYALADAGRNNAALRSKILTWYGTPNAQDLPAARTGMENGYGVVGMIGLVWEWTLDFNSLMSGPDLRGSGAQFCGGASLGASDASDYASFMRYSMRSSLKASYTTKNLGFRCAKSEP